MRNKYNYGELVKISGIGKEFGKVENKLGFIIRKDDFYDDYYIDMIFGEKDWFNEESLERVLGEKRNKTDKYQVRLCTTKQGYDYIKDKLKENEPISNLIISLVIKYNKLEILYDYEDVLERKEISIKKEINEKSCYEIPLAA